MNKAVSDVENRNDKWREQLSRKQIRRIEKHQAELLEELEYEV